MKSDSAAISVPSTDTAAKYPPEMEEIALESETKTTDKQTKNTTTKTAQKGPNMSSFYLQKQQQQQNKNKNKNKTKQTKNRAYFAGEFCLIYGVI